MNNNCIFGHESRHDKYLSWGFPTRSDTNRAVQSQKMARGLKFRIKEVEGLCCLRSENEGVDQQKSYRNRVIPWKVERDSYVVVLISYKYRNISY